MPVPIPRSFEEDSRSQSATEWLDSYFNEMLGIEKIGNFTVIATPRNQQILQLMELFSLKYDPISRKMKYKVRIIVRGCLEKNSIALTFAPVTVASTIRLIIAVAGIHGLIVYQLDVKNAFLYGRRT